MCRAARQHDNSKGGTPAVRRNDGTFSSGKPQTTAHVQYERVYVSEDKMKFHTEYLTFHTRKHREYVHITPQVEAVMKKSGIREGMVLVSAMHITAGVYVNDNESGLIEDIDAWLEKLAPYQHNYHHHETGEDNGDSHLKSLLVHHEVIVPITNGRLDLGPWQRIFYAEFDGQRDKRLIIKVMGE
jgi:secondary thiamine-phosphate synthase enzyme